MATIDTHLFIEIILSEQGVSQVHRDNVNGDEFSYFIGKNGRRVLICIADEFISKATADNYLIDLGLADMVGLMPYT